LADHLRRDSVRDNSATRLPYWKIQEEESGYTCDYSKKKVGKHRNLYFKQKMGEN